MIEIENLTKIFPGGATAVDDLTCTVEKGEIAGFLGPNGAGKSTALRILVGYLDPTFGSCRIGGYDSYTESLKLRRIVGYLPEAVPLYRSMRVFEYLDFRAAMKGVPFKERSRRRKKVISLCWLDKHYESIIGNLSKGYRQRVGLADALISDPEVLILDEPTVGLDPIQVKEMRTILAEMARKRTILFSSHILSEVEEIAGRIIVINKGRLVADGRASDIASRFIRQAKITVSTTSPAGDVKAALKKVPGVKLVEIAEKGSISTLNITGENEDVVDSVTAVFVKNGWRLLGLECAGTSLEDVFLGLIYRDMSESERKGITASFISESAKTLSEDTD